MFNIYFIQAGWMPISFGERKLDTIGFVGTKSKEVIYTSYIEYVKDELDELFNLDRDNRTKECELDCEGDTILLTTKLVGDNIDIKVKYKYVHKPVKFHYTFNYVEFLKEYINEFEQNKESYLKDFHYDERYATWDNDNYKVIKTKVGM